MESWRHSGTEGPLVHKYAIFSFNSQEGMIE